MGTSLAVFERVGLLDEDPAMRCAEDGEWAYRALRAGVPLRYVPDAIVAHVGWRGLEERVVQYRDYALSQGAFYGKHLARGDAFIALRLFAHELRALRRWARGTVQGDGEAATIGRAYALGLLPGCWRGLRSDAPPPRRLVDSRSITTSC
jgi:GT2 family glycosyltransferase